MTRKQRTPPQPAPKDLTGEHRSAPVPTIPLRSRYVSCARVATARAAPGRRDLTSVSIPLRLRDLVAASRQHPSQAYHEVVEAAMLHWLDAGGWGCAACMGRMAHRVAPDGGPDAEPAPRIA